MAKGNLLLLGGIGVLGALALNKTSGTNRSANIGSTIKDTLDLTDAASLAKIINGSKELQAYIKKIAGSNVTPPIVQDIVTSINNSYMLDGVQYQNFGGSILTNGAGELGNADNWSFDFFENSNIKLTAPNSVTNETKIKLKQYQLLKLNFDYKLNTGVQLICLFCYDSNGVEIDSSLYYVSIPTSLNFTNKTIFLSKIINEVNHSYSKIQFGGWNNANEFEFKDLIVSFCSLGEAVPSNLSNLPTGQEVYDSTTGDRGRYNGTTIDWYTMV